jgi:hypothetical protein
MNSVGESYDFCHLETDRHNKNAENDCSEVRVDKPQPLEKAEREYRNSENGKSLMVQRTVTSE